MKRIDFPKLRTILLDAILKNQSILTLVERAHECIGLPIICFDVFFRVVAYSFPRPFYYSHWENLVANGYAPDDVVVSNDYLSYQQMMYALGKSQIFDWGTSEGFPQACGPVMSDGQLIGYAGMMVEGTDPDDCVAANNMLSQAISVLMRKREEGGMRSAEPRGGFSADKLLIKDGISPEQAEYFAQTFPKPYIFAVLSPKDANVSKLQYVRRALCGAENATIGCLSGENYLCLLFYGADPSVCFPLLQTSLEFIASRHALTGGVSDYFTCPLEIPNRRMQAMLTLSVGARCATAGRISFFRECYSSIISYCAIERFGPSACILPEILALAREDELSGVGYLETLESYLGHFHRHSAVAAVMGLHKNTIINRMRKIGEILGQDVDDGKFADKMLAGINLYRMLERDGVLPAKRGTA